MMNDDTKDTKSEELKAEDKTDTTVEATEEVAEKAEEESTEKTEETSEELAKVIPFDPKAETDEALKEAQAAVNDAVINFKNALKALKAQLAPFASSLKEVKDAIVEGADNAKATIEAARKENDEKEAAEEAKKAEDPKEEDPAISAARAASETVNIGIDKLKERANNMHFNFKDAIKHEFHEYAKANLKDDDFTLDENGKKVVKIDGKFMQNHANEVVPALIRGTVGSFLKSLLGTDLLNEEEADKIEKAAEEEANKEQEPAEKPAETSEKSEEAADDAPDYRVEFDFADSLANAIRNAKVTPSAETEDEVHSRETGREMLIESARIIEDTLNGNPTDDAKERIEEAVKRVDMDDADKSPEDIQAIDEKHQRILEMSRQFEKNMNPDEE
jgi:hypothetical protein